MIMLYPIERFVIISGTMFGSVYLFSTSLYNLNQICIQGDSCKNLNDNSLKTLLIINGCTMLFSGLAFSYFTYVVTK
jgi:hypothetical protein